MMTVDSNATAAMLATLGAVLFVHHIKDTRRHAVILALAIGFLDNSHTEIAGGHTDLAFMSL